MIIEAHSSMQFSELIKEGVRLVVFWLPLSHPCSIQFPILGELSRELENKLEVVKVNAQDIPSLAEKYYIQAFPTLLLFKDGREIHRFIGVQSKESLVDAIKSLLVNKEDKV